MQYIMLIYTQEKAERSQEELQKLRNTHWTVMDEGSKKGVLRAAQPLKPVNTATTLRMQNGKALTTDGPFAETKEQLAGYYIFECQNLDEAIDWAAKIPSACGGASGCIEIRPLADLPPR
jgi:hypothetical protein